jgi:hypothetical protein
MKEAILKLKNEIKQCTIAGRAIGEKIRQSKGLDRYQLWNAKRSVGDGARYVLLAYACLRERPYLTVERKVRQGNEPSATSIHNALLEALGDTQKAEWTRERVKAWLEWKPVSTTQETIEVAA